VSAVREAGAGTPPPETPETIGATVRRLAAAQKSSKGAPAYSRFVNRPLGRVFAAVAYRLGLTPDAVTAVSAAFTFAAIGVLALVAPSAWVAAAVCAGLVLGYALDAADGQLARLRGGGSLAGEWLDHMVDATKIVTLHLAVAVWLYRFSGLDVRWVLLPFAFTVAASVHFFGMILTDQLRRQHSFGAGARAHSSALRSLAVLPTDYGVLCLAFALLALPRPFLAVYGVLGAGTAAYTLLAAVKWFRELRAMAPPAA
jgi:phosphatidylglycerophosphate synthase